MSAESQYKPVSEHDWLSLTAAEQVPEPIRRSPHFWRYVEAAQAGYSIRQLERYAERSFGEQISRESFRELQKLVPVRDRIPETYQETVLNGVDADLEVIQDLKNLIAVQKVRVTKALAFEMGLRQTDGGGTIPLKATADEIRLLHLMLRDYANMEITLGILNRAMAAPTVVGGGVVFDVEPLEAQVIELRKKLTDQEYDKLLEVVDEIEASLSGWVTQVTDGVMVTEAVDAAVRQTGMEAADDVRVAEAIGLAVT